MSRPVRYAKGSFQRDLRVQVQGRLEAEHRTYRASWRGFARGAPAVAWFYGSYLVLVLVPLPTVLTAAAVGSLGVAATAMMTNVIHDGEHQALSANRWINWAAVYVAAPFGVSGRWWGANHNLSHHPYTDVAGHDTDLDHGAWMRMAPTQPWKPWHRYQHLYVWALYPLLWISMVLTADLRYVVQGRLKGGRPVQPAGAVRTSRLLVEKFGGLAIVMGLAARAHPIGVVVAVTIAAMLIAGTGLAAILAVSHYVDTTVFPQPDSQGAIADEWAVAQVRGAANVRIRNPIVRWFFGGMHHHIEHHLFPRMAHVHYPVIAPAVRQACAARGLPYQEFPNLGSAFASHFRYLRKLGQPPVVEVDSRPTLALDIAA